MPRRSYLQRIAAPLAPGEPVLFSVPGPAPGEARPAVPGGVSLGSSAVDAVVAKPAPRRASTRTAGAPHASLAPGTDGAAAPFPAGNPEIVAAPLPAPRTEAAPPSAPAAIAVAGVPAASAGPAAAGVGVEREVIVPNPEAIAALDWGAPVAFRAKQMSRPVAAPAPTVAARAADADTSGPPRPAPVHPAEAYFRPAGRAAEPHARAEPIPTAPRDIARSSPPRIYIGTVEVRTSPAPAPPPAPPPPTPPAPRHAPPAASVAPVTRGYGWRFGLVQG